VITVTKQKKLMYNFFSDIKPTNIFEERISRSRFKIVLFDRVYTAWNAVRKNFSELRVSVIFCNERWMLKKNILTEYYKFGA